MQSKATTVEQYIAELPPDRREAIKTLREVFLRNLGAGFEERMGYGMMGYAVPHSIYPSGYHCDPKQPLPFAGLASQKQHISVYIMSLYGPDSDEAWFRDAWAATGKKLDMGKCCVRFRKIEDAALDVIGEAIRRWPLKKWIAYYEAGLAQAQRDREARKSAKAGTGAKARAKAARSSVKGPAISRKSRTRGAAVQRPAKPSGTTKSACKAGRMVRKASNSRSR